MIRATGELHAVSYSFARGRTVQYSVIDTNGRARRTVDIEVTGSPMMHDFSLTDKYVVIYDLPVTFDPVQVMPRTVPRWLQRRPGWSCSRCSGGSGSRARSRRWSTATRGAASAALCLESGLSGAHRRHASRGRQ